METYDAIVLGAGAMGSAAAYYLAKAGQKVLLLEQFELDHQRGSSYGYSRIIRYSYDESAYIELARSTYPLWTELESEAGITLYKQTGGIDFGMMGVESLDDTIKSVQDANIAHEVLDAAEASKRFPQFHFDENMSVLFQPDSGMLYASKCVRAHIKMAKQHGATLIDNTPVVGMTVYNDSVVVDTKDFNYSAGKLIITAGAWAQSLLTPTGLDLPLKVWRTQPMFFEPVHDDPTIFTADHMPVFIHHREGRLHSAVYGLPDHDNVGVKAAFHHGDVLDHPSQVDYATDDKTLAEIREFTCKHIPAIGDGRLKSSRICLYTVTPDDHFIVDQHPRYPHIVVGAGFSGHGFKFATGIGSILCDLVLKGETEHNISLFKATRFG